MEFEPYEIYEWTDYKEVLRLAEDLVVCIMRSTRPCELTLFDLYMAEATEEAARLISRLELTLPSVCEV